MLSSYLEITGEEFDSLESRRRLGIAGAEALKRGEICSEFGRPCQVSKVLIRLSQKENAVAHLDEIRQKIGRYFEKLSEERSLYSDQIHFDIVVTGTMGHGKRYFTRTVSLSPELMGLLASLRITFHFMACPSTGP